MICHINKLRVSITCGPKKGVRKVMHRLRMYHAILAAGAILAYVSGEWGIIHSYIGYGLTAVILFRLLWTLRGEPQFKLSNFVPSFKYFTIKNFLANSAISTLIVLGLSVSLIGTIATGIALDRGRALGLEEKPAAMEIAANGEQQPSGENDRERRREHRREKSSMREAHETFADIFLLFAILHAAHMFKFQRPMTKFMLFMNKKK